MTTEVPTYREASYQLLSQARTEFEADDLRQASEKAWGAAAQMVKAVCQERGWEHHQHRHLWNAALALARDEADQRIHDLFLVANGLHANFYENTYDAEQVALDINRVDELTVRLEALLDA